MSGSISKIPILIITLVIGFIMVTTAVLPLAADYSEAKKFTNEGLFFVEGLDENQTVTYSCDSNGVYVNGVEITGDYATGYSGGASIAYTENFVIRWGGTGPYALRGAYWAYNSAASSSITFSGNGTYSGTYTAGGSTTSISGTFTEFYGLVLSNSDRVMTKSTSDKYVNGDTVINGTGLSRCVNINEYYVINIDGSVDDGIAIKIYSQLNGTEVSDVAISNIEINKTEVPNYVDLYNIESITFDVTLDDKTDSLTYTVFTIPEEISADPDNPSTFKNMVRIVPLIALVALVAAAAGMIYFKGKE